MRLRKAPDASKQAGGGVFWRKGGRGLTMGALIVPAGPRAAGYRVPAEDLKALGGRHLLVFE